MPQVLTQASTSTTAQQADVQLPINPFTALQVHFGMLLGVDDLETLEGYPRGKLRLHNAWLHGAGVVWGLGIDIQEERGELQVNPGLALDASGHELHLDTPSCVNLGAWYAAHKDDPGFVPEITDTGVKFDAHVVIRFKACLTRPVPSISEPCEGATQNVAFSRAQETVELFLRPNLAPPRAVPYHRLRLLFGLDDPRQDDGTPVQEDLDIIAERDSIRALPPDEQPKQLLAAFRRYAALDSAELQPASGPEGASTLFPALDPNELVLADVKGILLNETSTGWVLATPLPVIDSQVRPSHVATSTIQELLCAGLRGAPADAGGPRVIASSVTLAEKTLTFTTTKPVERLSLTDETIFLSYFSPETGWAELKLAVPPESLGEGGTAVSLELDGAPPAGALVRLVVRGTGPQTVLGVGPSYLPLAGGESGPPGTASQGHDFSHQFTLTQARS
ncbi:hypothetical protein [Hyalangium versicolor]|uniref:hypothetical protein n=1 Tax=Hyalangium versicolor TaxID=2861190 RepID=UPI001CCFE8EC|nr:hypothetical protein [Hyalangium versicolor]